MRGRVVPRFTIRDRDRALATIPFGRLPTRYPFTLMIPQQVTEAILLDRLRRFGGSVQRRYEVERVAQDGAGASLSLRGPGGVAHTRRARYVVGCVGMHSRVREHSGIGFAGDAYAHSFALADVRMTWPIPGDEVMLFLSPAGLVVVAPLPGDVHRIVATFDDAPEHPGVDDMQRLLDTRGPGQARVDEVLWSSRFRVHHRLADRYRTGRLLLAGDAAHVHSPAGGHSLTDGMTTMATLRSAQGRFVRNAAIRLIGQTAITRRLAFEFAGMRNCAA